MLISPSDTNDSMFLKHWTYAHPGTEPMGWKLREAATRWVRFHALPQSKRYAENTADRETILLRANALGTALLGIGAPCWIVEARTDEVDGQGEFVGSYQEEPDAPLWRYHVREADWFQGKFDAQVAEIADDGPAYVIWVSRDTGGIFAPYDGGFDLFPESDDCVQKLRMIYREWLSDREDGL